MKKKLQHRSPKTHVGLQAFQRNIESFLLKTCWKGIPLHKVFLKHLQNISKTTQKSHSAEDNYRNTSEEQNASLKYIYLHTGLSSVSEIVRNHKERMLRHNPQFISFSLDKDDVYKNLFTFCVANVGDPDRSWASQSFPCLMSLSLWQHISYLSRTAHCLKNASLYSDTTFPVLSQLITNKTRVFMLKTCIQRALHHQPLFTWFFQEGKKKCL